MGDCIIIRRRLVSSILGAVTLLASLAAAAPALAYVNWPSYQFDLGHSSLNSAATTITPSNAGALTPAWSKGFSPATSGFTASPVVYNGSIYIGDNNGGFYQLNEATGAVVNSVTIGREAACSGDTYGYGVEDTATVAPDPSRGGAPTVYVAGGNGQPNGTGVDGNGGIYLWALDANTLKPVWTTDPVTVSTQPGATGWASPVVSNGTISVGIASGCDSPEVEGGLSVFSQSNGAPVGTYWAEPAGNQGAPIWSSPVASGSSTWVATGNAMPGSVNGDSYSIVRLQGATKVDSWTLPGQAPADNDFGDSPTLFTGLVGTTPTSMIGDCNKNGTFYALRSMSLSSGPVWTYQLGASGTDNLCSAGAVWDAGARELIVGSTKAPSGQPGSIQALSPDTGAVIWKSYLPCPVEGPPSEDGAGVLAVVTFNPSWNPCTPGASPSLYLYNAHATVPNGSGPPAPQLLKTIPVGVSVFSQPAFADGYLFVAGDGHGNLMAYAALDQSPSPPVIPPPVTPSPLTPSPVTPPPASSSGIMPGGAIPGSTVSAAQIKADLAMQLGPEGKAARIGALLKRGGYTYRFKTLTAGRVVISWYYLPKGTTLSKVMPKPVLIATGKASFTNPGQVKLTIKLTAQGKRVLRAAKRLSVTAKGIYTLPGQAPVLAIKATTLNR